MLEILNMVAKRKAVADKTTSLLRLDGSDEMLSANQIKDAANPNRIWSLTTGSVLNSEKVKFGDKAFKVSGGNGLLTPHDASMLPGSVYTLEMWVNIWDYSVFNFFMTKSSVDSQNPFIRQYGGNTIVAVSYDGSSGGSGNTNSVFVAGNWAHVALVVNGSIKRLYLNGILVRTDNNALVWGKLAVPFVIGSNNRRNSSDTQSRFYAQAFRASRVERYTSNFVPPNAIFELD